MKNDDTSVTAVLSAVLETSAQSGVAVYVVGGKVRDTLLARNATFDTDIDMVVEGDASAFAEGVARKLSGTVVARSKFGTAKVKLDEGTIKVDRMTELDFASARKESYAAPGAQPTVQSASLQYDLMRRDFSINAIAVPVSVFVDLLRGSIDVERFRSLVVDPCGGLCDLDRRMLRILHEHSFQDDPTRLLRGLRYRARLDGDFELGTQRCFDEAIASDALRTVSPQRIFAELTRWVFEPQAVRLFTEFDWANVLPRWGVDPDGRELLGRLIGRVKDESPSEKQIVWIRFAQRFINPDVRHTFNVSKIRWREVTAIFESESRVGEHRLRQLWDEVEAER
jgi:tRNA nucleotidyltransferase/poly(A) polymerase